MAENCIFCKIIAKKIPCHKILENDHVLAFLDIMPLSKCHALVVPKVHYPSMHEMPSDALAAIAQANAAVAKAVSTVAGTKAYNVLLNNGEDAGQEVMHAHYHIVPRFPSDGLGYRWKHGTKIEEGEKLAAEVAAAISK